MGRPRVAVVGHMEWVRFARVDRVPVAGGIAHATEAWEGPGGGGGVASVQLARLAGQASFFTALGSDDLGARSRAELGALGVDVHAAARALPTRSALTMIDDAGERTIVTLGDRLEPRGDDPLPWQLLSGVDAVFVTAGDDEALRRARAARLIVGTSRILDRLASSRIRVDVVVGSALDPREDYDPTALREPPAVVVRTEGSDGGTWHRVDGTAGRYEAVAPPGAIADTYGAGDSFQAGLTYGLAAGMELERALELAARCGAHAVTGHGPTGGQLDRA